jgi:hypothetical protein
MVALYIAKRKKRPESIPCYLTMLEFKYFEIQLFQVLCLNSNFEKLPERITDLSFWSNY